MGSAVPGKRGASVVHRHADLHPHLPVGDFSVLDVASGFHHLEPPHLALVDFRLGDRILYRCFDADVRRADEFDHLVGVFGHWLSRAARG